MRRILFLLPLVCACQGAPQYAGVRAKPDNELNLGWGRSLRFGAETEGTLKGLRTSNGTTIDELTLKQSPAATMANGWTPAMMAYVAQQQAFVPILRQYGDNTVNILGAVNEIAKTVMPGVMSAIQGHYSVAQAKVQADTMKTEIIGAIGGGLLGLPQAKSLMGQLPIDIEKDVMSNPIVQARLAQDKAALDAALKANATTQPVTP